MDDNPYEVYVYIKDLGHGSFGNVKLYRNTTDNSLVAWKEIDLKKLDPKMRSESFAEVEILAMLDHPNVISYYRHFLIDDVLYIEMEYAKSGSLDKKIKERAKESTFFDQETVIWYLYQVTSAIEYIHANGIMHRDIKCLNLFIMQSDLLKLGDFGISKTLDKEKELLETVKI
jgi:serine/threonine protein kinase